jgi:hypothetical protein
MSPEEWEEGTCEERGDCDDAIAATRRSMAVHCALDGIASWRGRARGGGGGELCAIPYVINSNQQSNYV